MGRPPLGKRAMTDAERQRRRRQRLAAEQPWDAKQEAKKVRLRLSSRGLGDAEAQELAAALGSNVTPIVTKAAKQTVTPTVTKLRDIHKAYAQAAAELLAEYGPQPKWEKLPLELREVIIGVYHIGKRDGRRGAKATGY
jgi:hypothetical protein